MKTINILNGDTLEGASVGDWVINGYGEKLQIVDELGSIWILELTRVHSNGWVKGYREMFKYRPNAVVLTNQG